MEAKNTSFRENIFFYILIIIITVIGTISYYRFMVNEDYLIRYEGVCDPTIHTCFVGCEDDECTTEYYYSDVVKYAPDLYAECGKNITDCEIANICLPKDKTCTITYCDTKTDNTCDTIIEEPDTQDNNYILPNEKVTLPDNNTNNTNI